MYLYTHLQTEEIVIQKSGKGFIKELEKIYLEQKVAQFVVDITQWIEIIDGIE